MRAKNFGDVCTELGKINWEGADSLGAAANVLADVGTERLLDLYIPLNRDAVTEWVKNGVSNRVFGKPTNAKFWVGGTHPNKHGSFTLMVNDYSYAGSAALLDACDAAGIVTGPRYVENWHTHRHDFTSIQIGDRGFTEDRVSPTDVTTARMNERGFWMPEESEWNPVTRMYSKGDIMTIRGPLDIHRVRDAGAAITVLVQGPNQNGYSQTYAEGGAVTAVLPDMHTVIERGLAATRSARPVTNTESL